VRQGCIWAEAERLTRLNGISDIMSPALNRCLMFCPKCGVQLPDGSEFCFKCGTSLQAVAQVKELHETAGVDPDEAEAAEAETKDQHSASPGSAARAEILANKTRSLSVRLFFPPMLLAIGAAFLLKFGYNVAALVQFLVALGLSLTALRVHNEPTRRKVQAAWFVFNLGAIAYVVLLFISQGILILGIFSRLPAWAFVCDLAGVLLGFWIFARAAMATSEMRKYWEVGYVFLDRPWWK